MVRWVVGSILHGVDPWSYFSFQPVLHDWCNKGYPVCGMVNIKEPLLLIGKSSLCGDSGFPFSLSEWSLTICLAQYNRKFRVYLSLLYFRKKRNCTNAKSTDLKCQILTAFHSVNFTTIMSLTPFMTCS